jgi:hypothetical protein
VNIGSKDTGCEHVTPFMEELRAITGIDEMVLWKPAYMRSKSVAAKMSWAHNRETSRKEDLAYCLMGLFDVNMPLLYGEGNRAFVRLQEEIIKTSDDHSVFAWDRDIGESRTVSCLASHPSWFKRGAHVVPFGRKQTQSTSYAVTNKGVQIELPLFENPTSKVVYGLIDCHWDNTLTACIGIPLQGNLDSQFFERSSRHQPEAISVQDMYQAKRRTIFLSTRPVIEFPFAAEVTLQIYDNIFKELHGFFDVEITNNPLASLRWHPEYVTFVLRWPATKQVSRVEAVNLLWRHESHRGLCLAVCIEGRLDGRRKDGLGHFAASRISISTDTNRLTSKVKQSVQIGLPGSLISNCLVSFKQTGNNSKSDIEVTANLRKRDIFGNEVYTLKILANE